jgi:hypothetical protein
MLHIPEVDDFRPVGHNYRQFILGSDRLRHGLDQSAEFATLSLVANIVPRVSCRVASRAI